MMEETLKYMVILPDLFIGLIYDEVNSIMEL